MSTEWFYARGELQMGPVSLEVLLEKIKTGEINPNKDLVWAPHMRDWQVASQVAELKPWVGQEPQRGMLQAGAPYPVPPAGDVEPGSDPIDIFACLTKGFELVKQNFVNILVVGVVYFGICTMLGSVSAVIRLGYEAAAMPGGKTDSTLVLVIFVLLTFGTNFVSQAVSLFLSLGWTRIGLRIIASESFEVPDLFREGRLFLRALGASILFGLAVMLGFLLLIVPGVYLLLRYGYYLTAMVDRDLGIMESFEYSGRITQNNLIRLLGLGVLCFLITLAGLMVCGVGAIFTGPIAWLSWLVAYRWLQSGRAVAALQV